jgi:hypothetical protein
MLCTSFSIPIVALIGVALAITMELYLASIPGYVHLKS